MGSKTLFAAALLCASGLPAQAPAQEPQPTTQEPDARATNLALLQALEKRRAELMRSAGPQEPKSYALEFLDRQIARVKADIEADKAAAPGAP